MDTKGSKPTIKIELTAEQREEIRKRTGKEVPVVELKPEVLEERIAPAQPSGF